MQDLKFISQDLNKSYSGIKSLGDFLDKPAKTDFTSADNNNFEKNLIIFDPLLDEQELLASNSECSVICNCVSISPLKNISLQLKSKGVIKWVKNLHILAHGSEDGICFAGELIDEKTLIANADVLRSWKIENLFLWSCEIGKNKNFISLFSELTGAKVFSSEEKISRDNPYVFDNKGKKFNLNQIIDPKAVQNWNGNLSYSGGPGGPGGPGMPGGGGRFADKYELQNAVNDWCYDEFSATSMYGHISSWDVSQVTDFSYLFTSKFQFDDDISAWDVSNGTNFESMFRNADSFNGNIGGWDVGNGTNFTSMFENALSFNQDLGLWNVSSGTSFNNMFRNADSFNGNIGNWDVGNGTNFTSMFQNALSFNQNLSLWDVSSATTMDYMFSEADSFDGDIKNWVVGSVTEFRYMFYRAYSFNQNIGNWDVSSGETFDHMFNAATAFDQDISSWDVSNGTNFNFMFRYGTFDQDISSWDVSSEAYISYMFEYNTAMQTGQGVDADPDRSYFTGPVSTPTITTPTITTTTSLTNNNTPTIEGTAEAGSTVNLYNDTQSATYIVTVESKTSVKDSYKSLALTAFSPILESPSKSRLKTVSHLFISSPYGYS